MGQPSHAGGLELIQASYELEVATCMPVETVMCIDVKTAAVGPSTRTDRGAPPSGRRRRAIEPVPQETALAQPRLAQAIPSVSWIVTLPRVRKAALERATTAQCEAPAAARPGAEAPIVRAVVDSGAVEGGADRSSSIVPARHWLRRPSNGSSAGFL